MKQDSKNSPQVNSSGAAESDIITSFQNFFDTLGESHQPKKYTSRVKNLRALNTELQTKTTTIVGGSYNTINQTIISLNMPVTDSLNKIQSSARNTTSFNDQLYVLNIMIEKSLSENPGILKL
jgi:hypothetical protein